MCIIFLGARTKALRFGKGLNTINNYQTLKKIGIMAFARHTII